MKASGLVPVKAGALRPLVVSFTQNFKPNATILAPHLPLARCRDALHLTQRDHPEGVS